MRLWQGEELARRAEPQVRRARLSKAPVGASKMAALGGERLGRGQVRPGRS